MEDRKDYIKGTIIWAICALFFLYEFFLRTVIGAYQFSIMNDLNITLFEFSILSSTAFLMIYGIMQIPVGIVVDNYGLKKSLLFACILCSLSSMTLSYSHSFSYAILSRIIMAIGAAFGLICLLIAVNDWLPSKYRGIFIGLSQFVGTLGPMFAAGPLEKISQNESGNWRNLFMILFFTAEIDEIFHSFLN
jgi:MFS family permease